MKCELIRVAREYVNKKNEKKVGYNYYLSFENGARVCVKNVFEKDYMKLLLLSSTLLGDR